MVRVKKDNSRIATETVPYVLVRNVTLLLLLLLLTLCVYQVHSSLVILIILMLHYVLEHTPIYSAISNRWLPLL